MTSAPQDDPEKRLHVLMISEGCYPFQFGGVSTWCHGLLSDLSHVDFTLLSLACSPELEIQFDLPPNVRDLRVIPLWGTREALENQSRLSLAEITSRKRRTTEDVIVREFLPSFSGFLCELFGETGEQAHLACLGHDMYRFFMAYDFDVAMRSWPVWHSFVRQMQRYFPEAAARHGYPEAEFHLKDLTKAMQWLYHWLFPLAAPLPRADVAHAAMAGICGLLAIIAKLEYGAAFLLSEHGIYLREAYLAEAESGEGIFGKWFKLGFARRMTELSYAFADQISPCCDYNHRWELRNGARRDRVRTINYGVDGAVFTPAGKPFGDPPVVVWVGRIAPLKDLFTLLRAAAVVREARPDVQFRLYGKAHPGDEAYFRKCLALHAELGLEETVIFGGFRARPATAFNEGDLVVLSSVSEGWPFALMEAMLCEKPVVATSVGGVPEEIEGCGIAVEPRNPEEMAQAILALIGDPQLCASLGRVARKKVMESYSLEQQGNAHDESYRRIASREADRRPLPLAVATLGLKSLVGAAIDGYGQAGLALPALRPQTAPGLAAGIAGGTNGASRTDGATGTNGHNVTQAREAASPTEGQPGSERAGHIAALAAELIQLDPMPLDALEVTALLESQGITDGVAAKHYGAADAFDLGRLVLAAVQAQPVAAVAPMAIAAAPARRRDRLKEAVLDYARGPLAVLPTAILLLALAACSLLAGWTRHEVLVLCAGMTCSMVATVGFVQGANRRVCIYLSMKNRRAAGRFLASTMPLVGTGLVVLAVLAGVASTRLGWIRAADSAIFVPAFAGLVIYWLASGSLALVGQTGWLGGGLALGLACGIAIDRLTVPFLTTHLLAGAMVGIVVAITAVYLVALRSYTGSKPANPGTRGHLPSGSFVIQEAAPYFAYSLFYMLLILVPHVVGWVGALGAGQTRQLALASIEGGLTLALLPLALTGGVLEHDSRLFWRRLAVLLEKTPGHNPQEHNVALMAFYGKRRLHYIAVLAIASLVVALVFRAAANAGTLAAWLGLTDLIHVAFFFSTGLVAYGVIGYGIFNCMFCVTLARPTWAAMSVGLGIAMVLLGAPLSLGLHFAYSAIVFVLSALAFAMLSQYMTNRVLASADYFYVSSL
jgi:polysaccharide biosynthesis protein PelF